MRVMHPFYAALAANILARTFVVSNGFGIHKGAHLIGTLPFFLIWVLNKVFPVLELKESHGRDAEPGKR
jgi:hypothetical protein